MGRTPRGYWAFFFSFCFALVLFSHSAHGQSLGDVARQQREQNAKNTKPAHKVITDEDMPEHPADPASPSDSDNASSTANPIGDDESNTANKEQRGEELKQAISAEKQAIAETQNQIDKANDSVHYVEANRYSNGVQYNEHQARKQEEIKRLQTQLDERKRKLSDLQEKARREGFSSTIYDP
jgi:predicted RNase H-like nuclease (RuvC/YqgF family)